MHRLGFYLSAAQPVERVLPLIARAAKRAGQPMLVVAEEPDLLDRLDKALWEQFPDDFLAHGRAASREVWRLFDQREDVTREFHELEGGKWVQKA